MAHVTGDGSENCDKGSPNIPQSQCRGLSVIVLDEGVIGERSFDKIGR